MKIQYFTDTDTLLITFNDRPVAETRDLDENATLDLDADSQLVALTLEHASHRADVNSIVYQQVSAAPATAAA